MGEEEMKKAALLITALAFLFSVWAYSQEAEIDLDSLVKSALERNPGIKSLEDGVKAAKLRVRPAGALPDPVIGLGIRNMGLTRWTVGEEVMSEVAVSVSQMFPFPGKLGLKSQIASTRSLQAEEDLKAAKLALVREVKELYSRLYYYQRSVDLLRQKKEVLEKALKLAEVKYSVGLGAQPDIFKAQVEISGIDEMLLNMEQMVRTTTANINSLLDQPAESPIGRAREIPFYELSAGLDTLRRKAEEESPRLRGARLMVEEGETEVRMARKEYYPNFMVQLGKGFKGQLPDMYEVMVGVEIPLYASRKQAPLVEEAVSLLSSSRNGYADMRNELAYMITENYTMARTAGDLAALYKNRILPQARLAYESSLANYQTGKVDFLMLISDITNLFTYEAEYARNLSTLWSSAARLEELTSLELITPAGRAGAAAESVPVPAGR
jgi:outer membrane protein TolC